MHFGVAQRFAALIAGVRQMSLKLSAKASAGLPRSVRGYAGLWRGIASQGQGDTDLWRGMVSERGGGGVVLCTERRAFICFRGAGAHRGAGCPPVQKGKKQVQVPIFAGFAQKDVMTRLPYRNAP